MPRSGSTGCRKAALPALPPWTRNSTAVRGWPVGGKFLEPAGMVGGVERSAFGHRGMDVVAEHGSDHVHDVVPVVAQSRETLYGRPGFRWIVSEQLVGHDLVQC